MRVRRVDNNQSELVKQIRQIPGVTVAHTHTVSRGFPDIIVGIAGNNYLLEIKDPSQPPSKRKLSDEEEVFHKKWRGQVAVVETLEDVLKIINQ